MKKIMMTALFAILFSSSSAFAGEWTKISFKIKGTWTIADRTLTLSDDFKTKGAPDLKLFLSPLAKEDITGNNATEGSVLIAPLKSRKGGQEYRLPDGIDLKNYQSLVLHCEKYSKVWGAADLP